MLNLLALKIVLLGKKLIKNFERGQILSRGSVYAD